MDGRFVRAAMFFGIAILFFASPVFAQRYTVKKPQQRRGNRNSQQKSVRTEIEVVILTKRGAGIQVQEWNTVFRNLGVSLRVRQGLVSDTIGVTEQSFGTLRRVKLTGLLTGRGTLDFAHRTFSLRDSSKLKKWIDELKKFGAQGSPEGKALWGLNEKQFDHVFKVFQKPLITDVKGIKLEEAITAMKLPQEYIPKYSSDAKRLLDSIDAGSLVVKKELKGLSRGTSLAILLRGRGLGFHPVRNADASVGILIEPLEKSKKNWPVGWELSRFKLSRQRTAAALFKLTPVSLDEVPLLGTLDAIEEKTKIPIYLDRYTISLAKIDLENTTVSYQKSRTTWSLLIKSMCTKSRLSSRLKVDDAGKPFVWIAPFVSRRVK